LYFITSKTWNLRALQALLRSGVAHLFVEAYSTRLGGGYLRFQAQNLKRIRVPHWASIAETDQQVMTETGERGGRLDTALIERIYGLDVGTLVQTAADLHDWTRFVSMQDQYSLIYREEEREMFGLLADQSVSSIPYSPLAKGRVARPADNEQTLRSSDDKAGNALFNDPERDRPVIDAVQRVAEARGVPMAQITMAWVLEKPRRGSSDHRRHETAPSRGRRSGGRHRIHPERDPLPRGALLGTCCRRVLTPTRPPCSGRPLSSLPERCSSIARARLRLHPDRPRKGRRRRQA
jgi:hypothetical protein